MQNILAITHDVDRKLTYFGVKFETLNTTFRPASTGLDHALVVACGLTEILVEGSGCRWGSADIPIHVRSLLFDVNGLIDFTSVPLLLSA